VAPAPGSLASAAGLTPSLAASGLEEVRGASGMVLYVDRDADFSRYDSVLLDIVVLWANPGAEKGVSIPDGRVVTGFLFETLATQLQPYLAIAERPGAGVLLLRVAISETGTGLKPGSFVAATSAVPAARSAFGPLSESSSAFLRNAYIEATATDWETNELRVASLTAISSLLATASGKELLPNALRDWSRGLREELVEVLKANAHRGRLDTGRTAGER
jgi:hypothetical protein